MSGEKGPLVVSAPSAPPPPLQTHRQLHILGFVLGFIDSSYDLFRTHLESSGVQYLRWSVGWP